MGEPILFSSFFLTVYGEDAKLPSDSLELLRRLEDFEETERKKAEAVIQEKRDQVAEVLTQHLKRETQSGNLEVAIALRSKISELKLADEQAPEMPDEQETLDFIKQLESVTFLIPPGDEFAYRDGILNQKRKNGTQGKYEPTIDAENRTLTWKGFGISGIRTLRIDRRFRTAEFQAEPGASFVEIEIER